MIYFMQNLHVKCGTYGKSQFLTMIYIRNNCIVHLGDKEYDALRDDLILMREKIAFSSTIKDNLVIIDIQRDFINNMMDAQISDCRILYDFLHARIKDDEYLFFSKLTDDSKTYLDLLIRESGRDDIYNEKILRLLIVGLFSTLDRSRSETLLISNSTMVKENRFGRILKYISDNYRDITLEKTAEHFGYHPDYLSSRFRAVTGMSFSRKLLSIRMEEAIHRLLTTDYSINEIASLVGYQDRSHFSRNFHAYTGMSPKEYRRFHQKS